MWTVVTSRLGGVRPGEAILGSSIPHSSPFYGFTIIFTESGQSPGGNPGGYSHDPSECMVVFSSEACFPSTHPHEWSPGSLPVSLTCNPLAAIRRGTLKAIIIINSLPVLLSSLLQETLLPALLSASTPGFAASQGWNLNAFTQSSILPDAHSVTIPEASRLRRKGFIDRLLIGSSRVY